MKKTGCILAIVGFVTVVTVTFHAHAQPDQEGVCPNGNYDLIRVNDADDRHQARIVDQQGNHDQRVCATNRGGEEVYVDNDEPFPN
jgi:hypothetical protein